MSCGTPMVTSIENYRYSKLIDVVLEGVPIHRCPNCGEQEVEISRMEELHAVVAKAIAEKSGRLAPGEIRWLRTHLGYSGVDFAEVMGVTPETVSRWERLDEPKVMARPAEKLLRMMAIMDKPIEDYGLEKMGSDDSDSSAPIRLADRDQTWAATA